MRILRELRITEIIFSHVSSLANFQSFLKEKAAAKIKKRKIKHFEELATAEASIKLLEICRSGLGCSKAG